MKLRGPPGPVSAELELVFRGNGFMGSSVCSEFCLFSRLYSSQRSFWNSNLYSPGKHSSHVWNIWQVTTTQINCSNCYWPTKSHLLLFASSLIALFQSQAFRKTLYGLMCWPSPDSETGHHSTNSTYEADMTCFSVFLDLFEVLQQWVLTLDTESSKDRFRRCCIA